MDSPVLYSLDGDGIATITLNRPELRNPISDMDLIEALLDTLKAMEDDPAARVAILTGAGPAFSAGGNLKAMRPDSGGLNASLPARTRRNYKSGIQRLPLAFAALEVPVIAAVNGPAIGAGLDLACMCDLRVASVKLGIIPGDGGAWLIQRIVGFSKAAELTLTGETIDAAEALRIGLVNQVVPDAELMHAARAFALRIACNPSFAVRMAKRLIWDAQSMSIAQVLEMSAAMQAIAHATKDNAEAVNAFLEKRKPVFKGD
jgi:enoyl-CoA hydratase/carnithine racemase